MSSSSEVDVVSSDSDYSSESDKNKRTNAENNNSALIASQIPKIKIRFNPSELSKPNSDTPNSSKRVKIENTTKVNNIKSKKNISKPKASDSIIKLKLESSYKSSRTPESNKEFEDDDAFSFSDNPQSNISIGSTLDLNNSAKNNNSNNDNLGGRKEASNSLSPGIKRTRESGHDLPAENTSTPSTTPSILEEVSLL